MGDDMVHLDLNFLLATLLFVFEINMDEVREERRLRNENAVFLKVLLNSSKVVR